MRGSLQTQERSYGMMQGFVLNLNKQVNRLQEITRDVKRYDERLLNVPLVQWRTRVKGTPYENIINMYVTEISTEMGKIASGASASISELSVQTRQKWESIHDLHLPIPGMIDVMKETAHAANMRVSSAKEAIDSTRKRLAGTETKAEGKTVVERRKTASGKTLVKYSDGTIGEEK